MNFESREQEQVIDQDETFTGPGGSENQQQHQQVEKKNNKSIEKPLSTSNNKLIIKLKPDPMAAQEIDDGAVSTDRSSSMNISRNPASCKHCHKEFSSGKALGAHMRVHPNHSNVNRSLSAGMSRFRGGSGIGSKSYLDDLLKDGKPTCSICGKSFVSAKSLFGHMRCHPERHWRGMQPPGQHPSDEPAPAPSSPCSELISSSGGHHIGSSSHHDQNYKLVTDLGQCLRGWPVKDKRGRKSSIAKMSRCDNGCDDDDDEMLSSAVHGLMMLQAASNKHHPSEIGDGNSLVCKLCANHSEKLDVANNGILEIGFGGDDDDDHHHQLVLKSSKSYYDCGDGMETYESDHQQEKTKKRKVTRAINLKDIEYSSNDHMNDKMTPPPAAATERCYKCTTCDKSFPSPQALGGHRSSAHNKIFTRNTSNPQVLLKDAVFVNNCVGPRLEGWDRLDEDTSAAREVVHPPPALQHHVCRTCEKVFPSGQALGGHQRCHWQGPPSSSSSSSPAAAGQQLMNMMCDDQSGSPAAAAASTKKADAFDFDLNEFPANDHEEEGSK